MKNFITTAMVAILSLMGVGKAAAADNEKTTKNYEQMWEEVSKSFNNDLPKSALATVVEIRNRAAAESNQPQLLRALCTEFTIAHTISPDSDAVVMRRVEAAYEQETRPVEKALWQNALGQLKSDATLLAASVQDVEALAAAKATDYVPLFVLAGESYVFGYDLLHVLGAVALDVNSFRAGLTYDSKRALYERMRKVYEAQHNDYAVLVLDYRYRDQFAYPEMATGRLIERIRQIAPKHVKDDKKHHAHVAENMLQWVEYVENSTISVSYDWENRLKYPGMKSKMVIRSRNVKNLELRFYRIDGMDNRADVLFQPAQRYNLKKARKHLALTLRQDLQHLPAHESFDDTLRFVLPKAGVYCVELLADGKSQSREWLQVSRCLPVMTNYASAKDTHTRLTIVDGVSGKPFTAGVRLFHNAQRNRFRTNSEERRWTEIKAAADGVFDISGLDYSDEIAISAGDDAFCPVFSPSYGRDGYFNLNDVVGSYGRVFTDRAIYRPGQKVQFGGIVYSRVNDEYKAENGWKGKVVLQDTERKDIAEIDVFTDDFGQFNGEFTLPSPTIPGRFAVILRGGGVRTTEYISVEEYKRPTFRVKLDPASPEELLGKKHYEVGDTLVLNGRVETFSGVGVPDATVTWRTSRSDWGWLRSYQSDDEVCRQGEITSDGEGRFVLSIPLTKEGLYHTTCEATASNGETAEAAHSLYVGEPKPRTAETQEETKPQLFSVETSKAGDEASLAVDFQALPAEADRPVYVFFDVVSTLGGLVESQCRVADGGTLRFDLRWREEYGDGATAYVAFLKNGTLYTQSLNVQKPLPDKKLKLAWSTFRDKLQPGEQETWTLKVLRPDGTPADARVMARLYDASLDAFASRPWCFDLSFNRRMPRIAASSSYSGYFSMSWADKCEEASPMLFTRWEASMFDYFAMMRSPRMRPRSVSTLRSKSAGGNGVLYDLAYDDAPSPMVASKAIESPAPNGMVESASLERVQAEEASLDETAAAEAMQAKVRENFDETAFFMPALRTDAEGNVTINFTLPESLTEWNFTALAHEKNMNYGMLNDTIVARKKITAEIAAPRFLRAGDKTEIPVTVRNLTDAPHAGDLIFVVTDAKTGEVLKGEIRKFQLGAAASNSGATEHDASASVPDNLQTSKPDNHQTTFFFTLSATCDVNVRAVAQGEGFSDGEERNIPFIDGRETVQVSIPFSATAKGDIRLDLTPLHLAQLMKKDAQCRPTLTLEYCANPIWNVVRVVPALLEGEAYSANDWATRLYTIEVADFLSRQLAGTESAALIDSIVGAKDIPALRFSARDHLADYQRGDGGFSWFKGFYSSPWITADVCVLLAREQKMTGSKTANQMLTKAVAYLEGQAAEWVKEMKKAKPTAVPEVMMRYLYVRQLMGLAPGKNESYLLDLAAKEKKELTMYGKSVLSQIAMDSHRADAILALESLVEHTVATAEMGRYFDTERAFGGWASYKIPTQTMAIEALGSAAKNGIAQVEGLTGKKGETDNVGATLELQNAMKLWLLQSKRTQKWESSRASADATYALLHGDCNPAAPSQLFQTLSPEGYSKRQLSADETKKAIGSHSYNVIKESDGLSWGALYADYTLPVEMVESSGAGFALSRTWEVKRDGKWTTIDAKTAVKVGEHVRQTITLRAERDYDFVQVECSRAACLEPLAPLSGLCWLGGTQAYRMVRDSRNDYFFEHLAKGTHTFSEELIVDRAGTFATGIARVQSTFAPEFSGYAPSAILQAVK